MTVSSQNSRIEQLGDGTTTAFAVNFYFLENSDLKVFVNGVLQTITTNYTVTGAGNPAGGAVTFVSAPANGVQVVIFRDPAITQGLDYIDNDPFPAESHERGLDKLTMIAQRVKDLVSRALRLGDSVVGVSTELPALSGGQLLGTNPSGTGFQLYPLGSEPDTAANIVYTPLGTGAVATTVEGKLRETVSISDYATFQDALTALAGAEGTGYDTEPKDLDLLGQEITITTDVFVPINVTLINGTVNGSGRLIWRNPHLANTGLRAFSDYWPFMKGGAKKCTFNCLAIINVYIGAVFEDCFFNPLVMVNSDSLWTEFNNFYRCFFASKSTVNFALLLDGNNAGTSIYSTGTGVGTADGSFGYNNFVGCKGDAASGDSMMRIVSGGVLYNALIQFDGYQRGTTGAYFDIVLGRIGQSNFAVNIETFGVAANLIAVAAGQSFWYNTGSIQSASPEATFSQNATADLRGNNVYVIGCVLQDGAGATVFNGDTYPSTINAHLLKRNAKLLAPAVSIYLPTANQVFASNTTVKVTMTAEDFDAADSATTGTITPKAPGYYQVELALKFAATGTALAAEARIYKNGAAFKVNDTGPVGAAMQRSVSALVYCNGSTDTIEAYAYAFDNGGSPQIVFGSTVSYMTAVLVRPD